MALQFAVIWYGGRWTLLAPGVRRDRYASRDSALAAAHRLAEQARRQGYEVEVLVQDVGGELSAVPLQDQDEGPGRPGERPQDPANSPA
ncbi:hypothetical protein [Phenylobacterium sp.]|uniref:hypothetical protein n=1 Tax=Phenylobacterium sp. TaxID=1871053 RepID=UPI002BB18B8D|nr:hypothetical protein [Phenylobacterium sp.]HVI33282.1 hypothetical protein [Phenylobacterium sp.]